MFRVQKSRAYTPVMLVSDEVCYFTCKKNKNG
jgi:hypothetical protein